MPIFGKTKKNERKKDDEDGNDNENKEPDGTEGHENTEEDTRTKLSWAQISSMVQELDRVQAKKGETITNLMIASFFMITMVSVYRLQQLQGIGKSLVYLGQW
jgi:hypothetical protein